MTYTASEISKHAGRPVELYRYKGTYQDFYYTSGLVPVPFQADDDDAEHTYVPLTTRRSAVVAATQNDDNAEITIDMPVNTDLVAIYGFQIAPPQLTLTVFRGHTAGEFVRYWSGNVENIQVVRGMATLRVPSELAAALSIDFPNVYFQTPCNHTLFDPRCGVPFADWSTTTTMTAVAGKAITVASIGTLDGKLVGGDAILPSGERRMITAQVGTLLTINYPFASASVAGGITIATGCDLALKGDCKNIYNNTERFGGFPFIPPDNIFESGLEPGKDVADGACLPVLDEEPIYTFEGWDYRLRAVASTTICGVGNFSILENFGPAGGTPNAIHLPINDLGPKSIPAGGSVEVVKHWNVHDGPGSTYEGAPSFNEFGPDGAGTWAVRTTSFLINYSGCSGTNHLNVKLYLRAWNTEEVLVGEQTITSGSPWFYFTGPPWNGDGRGTNNSLGNPF